MTGFTKDIELIAAVGGYEDEDDVLEDALRELLRRRPKLRLSLAVEKYRSGDVSLNRAAELSGMSIEEFKGEVADRGISRDTGFLEAEVRERKLDGFSG